MFSILVSDGCSYILWAGAPCVCVDEESDALLLSRGPEGYCGD